MLELTSYLVRPVPLAVKRTSQFVNFCVYPLNDAPLHLLSERRDTRPAIPLRGRRKELDIAHPPARVRLMELPRVDERIRMADILSSSRKTETRRSRYTLFKQRVIVEAFSESRSLR